MIEKIMTLIALAMAEKFGPKAATVEYFPADGDWRAVYQIDTYELGVHEDLEDSIVIQAVPFTNVLGQPSLAVDVQPLRGDTHTFTCPVNDWLKSYGESFKAHIASL